MPFRVREREARRARMLANIGHLHAARDEFGMRLVEVVDLERDRRRREIEAIRVVLINSSGTSSNANSWAANPTFAMVKPATSVRRFSTMPTRSTQNLRHTSASLT